LEILKKIKNYRVDILLFLALLAIFAVLSYIFWGHQGSPLIDCGREAYVPSAMLKGQVLYKDIFILYGPFSYQLNTLLFKLFGEHLNTLYAAGVVNSLIILTIIYLIGRTVTSSWVSWAISLMVMILFIFHYFITNYIFPYAYAITYALSGFLLSVLFCIYYFKSRNPKFIPLSFLFIGISILSKIEYSLFLIILSIILFIKPVPKRYITIGVISLLIIPAVSWVTLIHQGLSLDDVTKYIQLMHNYSRADALKYFYKNNTGFFLTWGILKNSLGFFVDMLVKFLIISGITYLLLILTGHISEQFRFNFKNSKYYKKDKAFWTISSVIAVILIVFFVKLLATAVYPFILSKQFDITKFILKHTNEGLFSWLPISTTVILIFLIFQKVFSQKLFHIKNIKTAFQELELKDKILIFLAFIGIIATLKSYFHVDLHVFGTYILPIALLVNVVFLVDKIPDFFKFLDVKIWKITCIIFFIILSSAFLVRFILVSKVVYFYPISTEKGSIHSNIEVNYGLNQVIEYIKSEIPKDKSVLMIPEGVIVNFLTDRPSNDWYYSLIPNYIETFGEKNIVKDLQKNAPDYILLNSRDTKDYGSQYFCKNYGLEICNFVEKNYIFKKEFGLKPEQVDDKDIILNIKIFKKSDFSR